MKIKATFRVPRVDLTRYREALNQSLGEAIAQAAFAWLGATTAAIPVWSGASLATFQPLASELGIALSIAPVSFVDRISLGLSKAEGSVTVDSTKGKYEFSYSTSLEHLIYNEFNNANISPDPTLFSRLITPGPYEFQKKGLDAFEKVARDVRLPAPTYSIKTIRV